MGSSVNRIDRHIYSSPSSLFTEQSYPLPVKGNYVLRRNLYSWSKLHVQNRRNSHDAFRQCYCSKSVIKINELTCGCRTNAIYYESANSGQQFLPQNHMYDYRMRIQNDAKFVLTMVINAEWTVEIK